ncbi:MAG TPA: hypothetical protein VJ728_16985, partial [Candidatus Binataceae bacterium]|nr:hypothetical protein [Candidatus Binataceae bacterium]
LKQTLGYNPARAIREQVISLVRRGHDFQLHSHPKWFGARYARGRWSVHPEELSVDELFETQEEVNQYITERKEMLEEMVNSAIPSRKIRAYRAGALRAQPGQKLLSALAHNDIAVDSSVVWGLHDDAGKYLLDYREAPKDRRSWRVRDDVCHEDANGPVWEIPIYSVMRRRIHQLTPERIRAKFSSRVPKGRKKEIVQQLGIPKNPLRAAQFLFEPVPIKLDFHNLSPDALMRYIRSAPPPASDDPIDVLVLLGHTKEHTDDAAFDRFLQLVGQDSSLQVVSFDAVIDELQNSVRSMPRVASLCETATTR